MIRLEGIRKTFGATPLLDDVSFVVGEHERVGLVGRNGSGKTTLLRMIAGEETPDAGRIVMPRRTRVGWVRQHLAWGRPTIVDEVVAGLPPERHNERWRAERILAGLGFSRDDLGRSPHVFSGGFQVRVHLARALVGEPDLLLLDEPTNYLDIASIRWLAAFLREWPSQLILVTHDRAFMDGVVTHTVGLHRRRARKVRGGTAELFERIQREEEQYERTRANDEKRRREIQRFIERFRAKNTLATRVQSRIRYLRKHERLEKLERLPTLDMEFPASPMPGRVALRAQGLAFAWGDGAVLFRRLDLEVFRRDRVCVVGPNGRGKSTLLRILAGELAPDRGTIWRHPALRTGVFTQTHVDTLTPTRTVLEEIQAAAPGVTPQRARDVAGVMLFEGDAASRRIDVLSGGERARVMLARLLVRPSSLLLLDEPTNHLDMDACDALLAAIDAFEGAVVMVTHDETFLRTLATRFVVFDAGDARVVEGDFGDVVRATGWGDAVAPAPHPCAAAGPGAAPGDPGTRRVRGGPGRDRRARRRERAALVQERSRILRPLEAEIERLEGEISARERQRAECEAALARASEAGDGGRIAEASRRHARLGREIDALYDALAAAVEARDAQARRFDARLEAHDASSD